MEEIKKTSAEWQKDCEYIVMDPDGWDRTNYDYSWNQEEITEQEFDKRLGQSTTIKFNKK